MSDDDRTLKIGLGGDYWSVTLGEAGEEEVIIAAIRVFKLRRNHQATTLPARLYEHKVLSSFQAIIVDLGLS